MEVLCLVGVIRAMTVAVVARLPEAAVLLEVIVSMKVNILTFFQSRPVRALTKIFDCSLKWLYFSKDLEQLP